MKKRYAIFVFLLWALVSEGQDTLRYHAFGLRHDNDINFFTDCYFTSGVELKWYWPQLIKSPLKYIMLPTAKDAVTVYGITLTHHMYTPKQIFTPNLVPFDHPYSAYILLGQIQESFQPDKKLKTIATFPLPTPPKDGTTNYKTISVCNTLPELSMPYGCCDIWN